MTVAGLTITRAERQPDHSRESQTHSHRFAAPSESRRVRGALEHRHQSITGIDPLRYVIEEVLYRIGVLTGRGFTRCARCTSVRSALDDNELLIFAGRHFVMNFAVSDKVMSTHRRD